MSTEKTHYKRLINPNYLGAYSLDDGQDLTVLIEYVAKEPVMNPTGQTEQCTVAHLKQEKPCGRFFISVDLGVSRQTG